MQPLWVSIMEWNTFCYLWFNCIIERFVSNVCFKSFDLISISCDCLLIVGAIVSCVLWCKSRYGWSSIIFSRNWLHFSTSKRFFYVHISLGTFVFFLNRVQAHKCGIHIHSFYTNWMQRVNQSFVKNTHFVIICYKKTLLCCAWGESLWI